jgi:hypothetical protein
MKARLISLLVLALTLTHLGPLAEVAMADPLDDSPTACASQIGNCNYYVCREATQNCGDDGYLMHFGYRYCTAFMNDVRPKMSAAGAVFMDKVAPCLQQKLDAVPLSASCQETSDDAIASHPGCYIENGYCELSFSDKLLIAETIWQSLTDTRIDRVMVEILNDCGLKADTM